MAAAFVGSVVFANLYNNTAQVNPFSAIADDLFSAIVEHATGALPDAAQRTTWIGSGATIVHAFEAFALSDQFGVASQPDNGHPIPGAYDPFPQFFQIYELATGTIPTDSQTISNWWHYELAGGTVRSISAAFVGSDMFAQQFAGGVKVDPNSVAKSALVSQIIQSATHQQPSDSQVAHWVESGISVVGVFEAFALGDQFKSYVESQHILG